MLDLFKSFTIIFLAAAPGRTTFVLMMLASQGTFKNVFTGAALAFAIQSFISVLFGEFLTLIPQPIVHLSAGILFIFFSYSFWKQSQRPIDLAVTEQKMSIETVFLIIFIAEFGDVSQLAIATVASNSTSKISVFFLAVLALWTLTAIALGLGRKLRGVIKPTLIQKIASLMFLVVGIYLVYQFLI